MKLNEIFINNDCEIFKVINFYDCEEMKDWIVEKTNFKLIPKPNENLWDAYFVVKGYIVDKNKIEDCFIDLCIPERISEFAFSMIDKELVINNIRDKNIQTIPAMASECFGNYELYYVKENPQLGIDILKKGLAIANHKNVIAEDLGYILSDENQIDDAILAFKISEECIPSTEYTYWELYSLYIELGNIEEAEKYKKIFIENGGKV